MQQRVQVLAGRILRTGHTFIRRHACGEWRGSANRQLLDAVSGLHLHWRPLAVCSQSSLLQFLQFLHLFDLQFFSLFLSLATLQSRCFQLASCTFPNFASSSSTSQPISKQLSHIRSFHAIISPQFRLICCTTKAWTVQYVRRSSHMYIYIYISYIYIYNMYIYILYTHEHIQIHVHVHVTCTWCMPIWGQSSAKLRDGFRRLSPAPALEPSIFFLATG